MLMQRGMAQRIVQLSKELDDAKLKYQSKQNEKALERENILKSKLKPKGHLLLKN